MSLQISFGKERFTKNSKTGQQIVYGTKVDKSDKAAWRNFTTISLIGYTHCVSCSPAQHPDLFSNSSSQGGTNLYGKGIFFIQS